MREVIQTNSISKEGEHKNPPIYLYDCSGPYTDPEVKIDIEKGLPKLRESWLSSRKLKHPEETQMSLAKKRRNNRRNGVYCHSRKPKP